ncbi:MULTISPECIES: hypothetical protein [unclassified Kitasatospora]|uniref:hypothetical protein n=1 Tax=unclassified Kitasatospora TaxID=2633591 RepID=UPI0007C80AF7|nr:MULTISPECIES: hypothetical protein [unclassified Kitasatospora]
MDEDECLRRYGLRPGGADLDEIRLLLAERTARERRSQGEGDTEVMKLCGGRGGGPGGAAEGESSGEFEGFSVAGHSAYYDGYYGDC